MQPGDFGRGQIWSQIKPVHKLGHGYVFVVNDAANLYLLVDLTGDTGDDSGMPATTENDAIELTFDVDLDGQITAQTDEFYFMRAGSEQIFRSISLGQGRKPRLSKTDARASAKFGPSPYSQSAHRQWELSVPLTELSASAGGNVRLGFRVWSSNPPFDDSDPPNLTHDFSQLAQVHLATPPAQAAGGQAGAGPIGSANPSGLVRTINSEGKAELRRPDGSRRILNNCGWTDIFPKGQASTITCAEAQSPDPPPLPVNPQNLKWLDGENASLLAIMKALVGNDQQAVQSYLNSEGADWTVYEKIQKRTKIINQLLSQ